MRPSPGACLLPPPPGGGAADPSRLVQAGRLELPAPQSLPTTSAVDAAPAAPGFAPSGCPHEPLRLCGEPSLPVAQPSGGSAPATPNDVTICAQPASIRPSIPSLPMIAGVHAPARRREGLSGAPVVHCSLPTNDCAPSLALRGKGAKHARLCAGPWASALASMPPMPLTGVKRAQAGLADTPLSSEDIALVRRQRAACALASILPWDAAGFILGDSPAMVASRPVSETTTRLVRALTSYGVSSTEAAYSALGRLMSWVILHHPDSLSIEGSHVSDFLEAEQPSATTLTALTWLRDHCGLDIPARGPACRPYRCRPPVAPRSNESLSIGAVVALEYLAAHHPSEWVRGHAAGWSTITRLALRLEQAQSCVLNAFVPHEYDGETFTIVVGSVRRDKNPNPAKRRPRPIWGVIDGLDHADCIRESLQAMLVGVETSQFLLRDTDSPDGDPTIHGHAAKRFLLNVAEASAAFTSVEACEVGRFSMSTSQSSDLEPVAAMLQAHSMRASVLPDIYAGKAKVARVFDLLVKAHLTLRSARRAMSANPSLATTGVASWGLAGPFAERPTPQPLPLTQSE
ncbi:hypothetical protein AB1Y20_011099 [Prymnesium parvum]|uniref:Uncharacterized protein n=1 Tax=Prymnesium parvum TaxID=97485 RepID=A0AB34ILX6_PRYPA